MLSIRLLCLFAAAVSAQRVINATLFPSLPVYDTLVWSDCYEIFKCARLSVPAEINNKHNKDRIQLAIVKLPASDKASKKGAIHYSSGGFSASNTNSVILFGESLSVLFSQYDLIGIDNRGTGWSTPSFRCFESEAERLSWVTSEPPILGSGISPEGDLFHDSALAQQWERSQDFAKRCKNISGDILRYMGTYPVVEDNYHVMKLDGRNKTSWWGFSGGTHSGATFASLYPEAVDKFVLDGAVRSDLQYTVTDISYPWSIQDAEKVLDAFFYTCFTAGAVQCPFTGNSTAPAQLEARYNALDKRLRTSPLSVEGLGKFDYSALHRFLTTSLVEPGGLFPLLGNVLAEAEAGVAGPWIQAAFQYVLAVPPAPLPQMDDKPYSEATEAVNCLDSEEYRLNHAWEFLPYLARMLKTSPAIGGIVARYKLTCGAWKVRPVNRYPSPFHGSKVAGNIVYIGNTADPLTTLASARFMSGVFPGSRVIVDNAVGHISMALSAQSDCLYAAIFQFFNLDIVPPVDLVCQPGIAENPNGRGPPFGVQLPAGFNGSRSPCGDC